MLSSEDFKLVVQSAPLFSIDLVVLNEKNQILVGKRKNAPAKGYWFVPGGRVFKNEPLAEAFARITRTELGIEFEYSSITQRRMYFCTSSLSSTISAILSLLEYCSCIVLL